MVARSHGVQHSAVISQHLHLKCQVEYRTDRGDPEIAVEMALAQPRIDERRFPSRVGADQQTNVRVLDARNRGVEQVSGAASRIELSTVLTAIEAHRAEAGEKLLQGKHCLGIAQITGNRRDALARNLLQPLGDELDCLAPLHLALALAADIGPVEPAADEPVDRIPGLVGDPLLVDRLVDARQHAQHLWPARIDPDVAADRVHDVDRLGLFQFPRAGNEGIRLRGQRAHRAQIDDVRG